MIIWYNKIINNIERMIAVLKVLQFIFSNFWIWLGFTIILSILCAALKGPVTKAITVIFERLNHKNECYRLVRELILEDIELDTVQKIGFLYKIRTKRGLDRFVEEHLIPEYVGHLLNKTENQ
ncbi:MAG: hypothetical protein ACI4I2_12570 [Oscillospiraceae bacterium]